MLPDRVSNPGPLTYESGALPTALRGPAVPDGRTIKSIVKTIDYHYKPVKTEASVFFKISSQHLETE